MPRYLNQTRIKRKVRRDYGRVADGLLLLRCDDAVRAVIEKEAGATNHRLKRVKVWAHDEAEQHAKFGGTLKKPLCLKCRRNVVAKPYTYCGPCGGTL